MPKIDSASFCLRELANCVASVLDSAGSTVPLDLKAVWTAAEVCSYYRIGRDTLRECIAAGLPHVRINGSYRFERLKVKRFFERQGR